MAQETGTPRQLVFRSCHKAQRLSRYRPRRSSLNAGTLARLSTLSRQLRSITVPFTSLEAAADSITMDLDGLWLWTGSRLYPFLYAVCYLLGLRLLTEETSIQLTKSELHAAHSHSAEPCNRAPSLRRPKSAPPWRPRCCAAQTCSRSGIQTPAGSPPGACSGRPLAEHE